MQPREGFITDATPHEAPLSIKEGESKTYNFLLCVLVWQ